MATRDAPPVANFRVGVDNVIFAVDTERSRLLVLLIKRDGDPYRDYWCLPGTLVRQNESLKGAAERILAEKIRVENLYLEQLFTFDPPEPSPNPYLSISYFAIVRLADAEPLAGGAIGIAWYPVDDLPPLAFAQERIVRYGRRRLCAKLEYSPIAFEVLPETFTLSELYQFYAAVLGDGFSDYSNFRSRLLKLGFLKDTGVKISKGAGRPASLYRFDPQEFEPHKNKPMVFV